MHICGSGLPVNVRNSCDPRTYGIRARNFFKEENSFSFEFQSESNFKAIIYKTYAHLDRLQIWFQIKVRFNSVGSRGEAQGMQLLNIVFAEAAI